MAAQNAPEVTRQRMYKAATSQNLFYAL